MLQLVTQQTVNQNNSYQRVLFEHKKLTMEGVEIIFRNNLIIGFQFLKPNPPRLWNGKFGNLNDIMAKIKEYRLGIFDNLKFPNLSI